MIANGRPRVAVAGGGPGGCAAALALAEAGIDVIVFERGAPGKDKACGDAFLPDAVARLAGLGVESASFAESGGRRFSTIDLWGDGGAVWAISLGAAEGWIAPRAAIDQALRNRVVRRAALRYETTVTRVARARRGRWLLTTRSAAGDAAIEVDGVVLATGASNGLAKHWGIEGEPLRGASISAYAGEACLDAPRFEFLADELPGYGWRFPLADGRMNAGYCAVMSPASGLRAATERYLRRSGANAHGPLRGGSGPMWSGRGTCWHHDAGLTSCGDAAGLVDPVTGEGISAALESGTAAGRALAEFLIGGSDTTPLARYSAWLGATFLERYRPTAVRRVWANLCRSPGNEAGGATSR